MRTDTRGDGIGADGSSGVHTGPENGGTLAGEPSGCAPPPSMRGDRLPVGPGIAAQLRSLAADLGGAFENPGNLGQQESAPAGEIAQRSHRGIVLATVSSRHLT
jgi:hypothetical protein